jgi:type I restriction enzyme, S subunit
MKDYPAYKDSGFGWLGNIPENWSILPLRRGIEFLTDFESNGSFATIKNNVRTDTDEKFAWYVRATDFENSRNGIVEGNRTCDKETYEFLFKTKVFGGELLVTKRGEIGKLYLMPEVSVPSTLGPNLYLIRLNKKLYPRFAHLWFQTVGNPQLVLANKSTTIGALYKNDVRDCLCMFPSLPEQEAIADFLDRETAKIDELIAKKQRQIDLLHEQRTALINQAVTKGLNPDAPMKDSGVEWLGEVPRHWEVKRLRRYNALVQTGPFGSQLHASDYVTNGFPVVNPANMVSGLIVPDENKQIDEEKRLQLAHHILEIGDIVFARRGELGRAVLVSEKEKGWLCGTGSILIRFFETRLRSGYLSHYLQLPSLRDYFVSESVGSTMDNLNSQILLAMPLIEPPENEQLEIAEYVNSIREKVNQTIEKVSREIQLLKEYRTALISAAVTGKIDVREEG